MNIEYVVGDAAVPAVPGQKIIVHVCNDIGKWGKGFVLAISRRWKKPEAVYKAAFLNNSPPQLGDVQFVAVSNDVTVANLIGQHGVRSPRGTAPAPIRYESIRAGLRLVAAYALENSATVHMPRIGCGLAGGRWELVEPLINECLIANNVAVMVYDLEA